MSNVLLTGGCGYIGSHIAVELLENDDNVIIVDDLVNSNNEVIARIEKITNRRVKFYDYDICQMNLLDSAFSANSIDSVVHLAGLKAVGESVEKPLDYYANNLIGTINLMKCMLKHKVNNIVFSSSATVYGKPESVPIAETAATGCTNPYGWTKYMNERIIMDTASANKQLNVALLRYFNPVGAHPSGLIGEDPNDIPNNLAPFVLKVALGKLPIVKVFGKDYNTPDGTGVRDYIHIMDLAKGHLLALKKIKTNCGTVIYNLGTGKGYSVLEVIDAFREASGKEIPYEFAPRRAGDIDTCYADCTKAKKELGFSCKYDLIDMARDSWNWQKNNPDGYGEK